jgi:leucyl/phenylalanyl-tRNA--protein transferase
MVPWLSVDDPFPPLARALGAASGAPGLLAASLDIAPRQLERAYRRGIFPWYSEGQPVLWWSPDPRMILAPDEFRVSASLRKTLKKVIRDPAWEIRVDTDFAAVMQSCGETARPGQPGTWITPAIVAAYLALHRAGLAHSVETWRDGERVGGLYGVAIGAMFFGESMFARCTDASKIALAALVGHLRQHGVEMIDCQQNTSHLASLGGREIDRDAFVAHLGRAIEAPSLPWRFDKATLLSAVSLPEGHS